MPDLAKIEQMAVDVLAVLAPWLGPVPSAYLVGRASQRHLGWHWSIAVVAAVAVESIGVVSVVLALRLHEYNVTRHRRLDPAAPMWLAVVLVVIYFLTTISLTVVLDVEPALARYAPALFPLLAAVGAVNIALKNGQYRRDAWREERRRAARRGAKAGAQAPAGGVANAANAAIEGGERAANGGEIEWRRYRRWSQVPPGLYGEIAGMDAAEAAVALGHLPARTRRDWRARAARARG